MPIEGRQKGKGTLRFSTSVPKWHTGQRLVQKTWYKDEVHWKAMVLILKGDSWKILMPLPTPIPIVAKSIRWHKHCGLWAAWIWGRRRIGSQVSAFHCWFTRCLWFSSMSHTYEPLSNTVQAQRRSSINIYWRNKWVMERRAAEEPEGVVFVGGDSVQLGGIFDILWLRT